MILRSVLCAALLVTLAGCKTTSQSKTQDATDITNTVFTPGLVSFTCGNGRLQSPCWDFGAGSWEQRPVASCTMNNKDFSALLASEPRKFCNVMPHNDGPNQPPPPPPASTDPFKNPATCTKVGDTWQSVTLATSGAVVTEFTAANPTTGDINLDFCNQVGMKLVFLGRQPIISKAIQNQAILIVSIGPKTTPVSFKAGALTIPWTLEDTVMAKASMYVDMMTTTTPCPAGLPISGGCWFLGNKAETCEARCARANLKYDPVTCQNTTPDFCSLMREMLGLPQTTNTGGWGATGCGYALYNNVNMLLIGPQGCQPAGADSDTQRFCSCKAQ